VHELSYISSYQAPEEIETFWDWIDEYNEKNVMHPASNESKLNILLEKTKKSKEFYDVINTLKKMLTCTCKNMEREKNIIWDIEKMYKIMYKPNNWNAFLFSTLGGLFDDCECEEIICAWAHWEEFHAEGWTLPYVKKN
jgi:hypothetical protein